MSPSLCLYWAVDVAKPPSFSLPRRQRVPSWQFFEMTESNIPLLVQMWIQVGPLPSWHCLSKHSYQVPGLSSLNGEEQNLTLFRLYLPLAAWREHAVLFPGENLCLRFLWWWKCQNNVTESVKQMMIIQRLIDLDSNISCGWNENHVWACGSWRHLL